MGVASASQAAPFHLTEVDRAVLAQTDDEFDPHTWEALRNIIGAFNEVRDGPSNVLTVILQPQIT